MGILISDMCYKGTILKRNYRKITIHGHFPMVLFLKFHG